MMMIHTCAKNQADQEGSCISGVSVLQKVNLGQLSVVSFEIKRLKTGHSLLPW